MSRLPLVLMRLLTPVAFVAILVTARPAAEWEWVPLTASAVSGLAFGALDLRWPRAAGVLLEVAALFGTVVTVADESLTGPSLLCLSLLVLSSLAAIPPVEIITVAAVAGVAAVVGGYLAGQPGGLVAGNALAVAVVVLIGLNRRQYRVQARQARELLDQTRLTQEAVARSATLEERARLAREVHDIQAHSLSALSLHLQAAARLVAELPSPDGKLAACVQKAGELAQEGLIETRRAVHALRGDPMALPELFGSLPDNASIQVTGEPRELPADVTLLLYRTVQEGLSNARKHAAGAPVSVELSYLDTEVTMAVVNRTGSSSGLSGAGYGLTGLRERAELVGGEVTAGPDGAGWRLSARIPA
ncbi:sensor histidine kinase [Amycolatopsis sp. NPDC054798]